MVDDVERLAEIIRNHIKLDKMSFGDSGDIEMIDIDASEIAQAILGAGYLPVEPVTLEVLGEDVDSLVYQVSQEVYYDSPNHLRPDILANLKNVVKATLAPYQKETLYRRRK